MSLALFQTVGPLELLIVLGVVLLIFGPKRLPALGRQLGAGMREFKDSIGSKADDDDDDEARALGRPEHETTPSTADEAVPEKR
jgi:sec-independent protein translocase protein TatA